MKDKEFESIYREHVKAILKVAMYYTKDYEVAQEITQTTFFQLYTHFENVDLEYIYPWLVRTAKNLALNYNRNSKFEILGEDMEVVMDGMGDNCYVDSMETCYIRKTQKNMAKELNDSILERLYEENKDWYDAVTLVYCLGKLQKEVAEELGITLDVLHSRLYRAKRWIRKNYEHRYKEITNWF